MKNEYVELNADSLHSSNLANQSQGWDLDTNEKALAKALMSIFYPPSTLAVFLPSIVKVLFNHKLLITLLYLP